MFSFSPPPPPQPKGKQATVPGVSSHFSRDGGPEARNGLGDLCQGVVVSVSFSKVVHRPGSGCRCLLQLCLLSASLGHLLLRMNASEPELSLALRQACPEESWEREEEGHKPSEVKSAVAADSRLMEGASELSDHSLVVGLVGSVCHLLWEVTVEPEEKGKGDIFSLESRRPWPGLRVQAKGTLLCRVIGYLQQLCSWESYLKKALLPQKEPSSSFSKGPRPTEITYGAKVVP